MSNLKLIGVILNVLTLAEMKAEELAAEDKRRRLLGDRDTNQSAAADVAISEAFRAINEEFILSSEFDHTDWTSMVNEIFIAEHEDVVIEGLVIASAVQTVREKFGFNDTQASCLVEIYYALRKRELKENAVIHDPTHESEATGSDEAAN